MKFITRLCLEHLGGVRHAVCSPLIYQAKSGRIFMVPAGFVTDGASVPRPMWWLYPPFGDDYESAAVLHDYLYKYAESEDGSDNGHISRSEADSIFLEAMEATGFRATGRRAIYLAVRAGGWKPWRAYRNSPSTVAM